MTSFFFQVVFITGAGSGIGRLMSYKFADLGAIVICTDINKQTSDETANTIRGFLSDNFKFLSYFSSNARFLVFRVARVFLSVL